MIAGGAVIKGTEAFAVRLTGTDTGNNGRVAVRSRHPGAWRDRCGDLSSLACCCRRVMAYFQAHRLTNQ